MTRESLAKNIQTTVTNLMALAEYRCWNTISPHLTFIISDFNEFDGENFHEIRKLRNKVNGSKNPKALEDAMEILNKEFQDLYDVTLYIFKAFKNETVIEIQYYRKSNMEPDYYEKIKDNPPMFHAKIRLPSYAIEGERFDVNWEYGGGLRHYWNSFLYEFKYRRMMNKLKK